MALYQFVVASLDLVIVASGQHLLDYWLRVLFIVGFDFQGIQVNLIFVVGPSSGSFEGGL